MLSWLRCRFQNSPLRSLSLSFGWGRWIWTRFRPNKLARTATQAKGDNVDTPSPAIMLARRSVRWGLLFKKASSEAGRLVMTWEALAMRLIQSIAYEQTHVTLVNDHGPPGPNACISIRAEGHPERSSALLTLRPILGW